MAKEIKVVPDEAVVPTEVLADSIVSISQGMKRLRNGRLNDRALILLIHDVSGVGKREISAVLAGIESLEAQFLRKKK